MKVAFPNDVRRGQRQAVWLVLVLSLVLVFLLLGAAGLCSLAPDPPAKLDVGIDASPVDDRVAFVGRSGRASDLFIADLATGVVHQITRTEASEFDPAFSPDGRQIVFSRGSYGRAGAQLVVRDLDTGTERPVTPAGALDREPCWSREMGQIAFARAATGKLATLGSWHWGDYDVWVVRPDGGGLRRLTEEGYFSLHGLAATRDGRVVYSTYDGGSARLLQVGIEHPGQVRGFAKITAGSSLDLSPTDESLAAISSGPHDVWRLEPDGGHPIQVTRNGDYKYDCRWTYDGMRIMFLRGTRVPELWSIRADGSDLQQLADATLFDSPLRWRPR